MVEIPNIPNKLRISDSDPVTIDQNEIKSSWMGRHVNPHQDNEQDVDCEIIGSDMWAEGKITPPQDLSEEGDVEMGPAEPTITGTNPSTVGDQEITDNSKEKE